MSRSNRDEDSHTLAGNRSVLQGHAQKWLSVRALQFTERRECILCEMFVTVLAVWLVKAERCVM